MTVLPVALSCLKQLLQTYSDSFNSIENGNFVDVIYLDFRNAFDTVSHDELLFGLWMIGITGYGSKIT